MNVPFHTEYDRRHGITTRKSVKNLYKYMAGSLTTNQQTNYLQQLTHFFWGAGGLLAPVIFLCMMAFRVVWLWGDFAEILIMLRA